MLDIWVDIITVKILNMARDGYGLDTRLHNDYVDEIKKKTKENILCFLAEHDAEICRQTIDKIRKFIKAEGNPYGKPMMEFEECKKILRYLDAMEAKVLDVAEHDAMKWIPCSERLPEEEGLYVVSTNCGEGAVVVAFYAYGSPYWDEYVTAWMPKPEPYKEQTNGEEHETD